MTSKEFLPLAILNSAEEGRVEGRTRFQKLIFLIQNDFNVPEKFDYIPYDYGPFSKELCEEIERLERQGFVKRRQEQIPNGKKYLYNLTDEGRAHFQQLEDSEPEEAKEAAETVEQTFNDVPISRLLEYVYNNYPDYAEESVL
ncbi:hypothetical protein [Halorussus lipolyticus]|uniref:hypothetical protein n=1 Tax=Halorussus lipolyticus TaxID=3034024 RepID=UPI0023E81DF6|nr:hypothetical protein [Halorussus sp. DT80]